MPASFVSDETRLKIILNNLVSNAIKFRWKMDGRPSTVSIEAKNLSQQVEIKVADNGRGIAPEIADKVFNMFYRGTDSIPGSGLGLYILKETVTKLGGNVTLKSQLGEGATFTVTLPKKKI